jgi:hypothetical protein
MTDQERARAILDLICRDILEQVQARAYWEWVRAHCHTITPVQE